MRLRTLAGLMMIAFGLLVLAGQKWPILRLGRLPGDIAIRGKSGVFYFPLVTCLLVSVLLSVVFWLFRKR
jgi:ribose/xylose/arabinose/galactoside ABC-type transport system permease subunit